MWGWPLESCSYLFYKLRYRTLHMYFRLMAAIFDFPFTTTSESIHISSTVLLDPENMEDTVGILLPATIQDLHSELHVFPVSHLPF